MDQTYSSVDSPGYETDTTLYNRFAADHGEKIYTYRKESWKGRYYPRGRMLCPRGAWWLPAYVMQMGSGVGRPHERRGVGADHRPEVGAERNTTVWCARLSPHSDRPQNSEVEQVWTRSHPHEAFLLRLTFSSQPFNTSLPIQIICV